MDPGVHLTGERLTGLDQRCIALGMSGCRCRDAEDVPDGAELYHAVQCAAYAHAPCNLRTKGRTADVSAWRLPGLSPLIVAESLMRGLRSRSCARLHLSLMVRALWVPRSSAVLERHRGIEPGSSARFVQRLYPLSYCRYLCGC